MRHFAIPIIATTLMILASCDESLTGADAIGAVSLIIEMPEDMPQGNIADQSYVFLDVTSSVEYTQTSPIANLLPGLYDIKYEATLTAIDGRVLKVRAFRQSCVIEPGDNNISLLATCIIDTDDLIISEVFFTGTLLPSGNSYTGDDYVKLYNNTDHVIYADGIALFESKFTTTEKNSYDPDIMSQAMSVQAVYVVPGCGTDHPVQPGQYFLLADTGIDHRAANPNSFDLSNADFEWYDESSTPSSLDIDGPSVPNLDKWYCYTRSYWMLHNRGFKAFGIARIPINREEYLADYYYSYDYEIVTAAGSFPMTGNAYKMPNEWIIDVVNCSVASNYAWNVCASSLDCGWTSCGTISNDKNRFGKAVRRKLDYVRSDGTAALKDTNNSTVDFNSSVTPSEIELQSNGATQPTYDGVTPIIK